MRTVTVIEVRLLTGRYHAHVWGPSQYAMGEPEWPPSPWRLLRALASAWFSARPLVSTELARDVLIQTLGRCGFPEMWLPKTAFREILYFQPLARKRALHHDFFAVPSPSRFYFVFAVELSESQTALLQILLSRLRYFGRAESRASLQLVLDLQNIPKGFYKVSPLDRAIGSGWNPREVLCPSGARNFLATDLWVIRSATGRKRKERGAGGAPGMPAPLVDAVLNSPPLPDGSELVQYAQPVGSIVHELPLRQIYRNAPPDIVKADTITFRLCRKIPISLTEIVPVARAFRDAAVRAYEASNNSCSSLLSGRGSDGSVDHAHQHIYYLPEPATGKSEVTALVVRVPPDCALRQEEFDAMMAVEHIWLRPGDDYPVTVIPEKLETETSAASTRWVSRTPFLPPHRYRPGRPDTSPVEQVLKCIERSSGIEAMSARGMRGPAGVGVRTPMLAHDYVGLRGCASSWRWSQRLAHWFTLEFDAPVTLRVPIGADAHFGLGQFVPANDASPK